MYSVFRNLAIIMLSAKFFGLLARKCKAPQVVGEIIAGLLIGPCLLNLVHTSDTISIFAEIGVVLLMFTTGLGTNLKELLRAGPIATLIACVGVLVPLVGKSWLRELQRKWLRTRNQSPGNICQVLNQFLYRRNVV